MTSKLIPQNPSAVMAIRAITPNITTLSVPFMRFGKIKFGGRGTLVRLTSGSLAIFSPVALTPEVTETVNSLGGNIAYIIAPDIEHHIFLGAWKTAYPASKVMGPEGLYEKRKTQKNVQDVAFDYVFTRKNKGALKLPEEFSNDFDVEYWDSHANKELVFNYKPDRTLIEADLLFNLPATEQFSKTSEDPCSGIYTKLMHYFTNIHGKGQQRFQWYASAKDKAGYAASSKVVAGWEFDRIIPCHGDVIETGGNEVFKRIFAWHLK